MLDMEPGDIPIFSMLKSRLGYLSDRQKVIAENIANANTPHYRAHDLKPFDFASHMSAARGQAANPATPPAGVMAVSEPGHMQPRNAAAGVKTVNTKDSEETLDGNGVVLEDEMVKLTDTRMDYDAAVSFYQKSLDMLKLATRRPGA